VVGFTSKFRSWNTNEDEKKNEIERKKLLLSTMLLARLGLRNFPGWPVDSPVPPKKRETIICLMDRSILYFIHLIHFFLLCHVPDPVPVYQQSGDDA
jgi:hypothetical protein